MSSRNDAKTGKLRVLVTGSSGYIGAQLVSQLQQSGTDCISVDKRIPDGKSSAKNIMLDLCDREKALKLISDFRPDCIVHCGTNSALAYKDGLLESFRDDAAALANILEALRKFPDCRLIFFSSSYVYSGAKSAQPLAEPAAMQPSHNFGVAKLFFEQFLFRTHRNTVVFRLSSVFGPDNPLHPNAIYSMARECIDKGSLTVWGTGSRMMQYIYMQDVINCILKAVEPSFAPGVYNLGGSEYLSVADSAKMIAAFFKAKVIFLKDKPEGDTLPFMDIAKLKHSSAPSITPFKDSLNEYLEFLKKQL